MNNNTYCMCGEEEEDKSHLFCTCRDTWLVWFKCYEWMGLASTDHQEPKKHFVNFKLSGVKENVNHIWDCVNSSCRRIMET